MGIQRLFGKLFGKSAEPPVRTAEQQQKIEQECHLLALYLYDTCPFCIRVKRVIRHLDLPIEERNTNHSRAYKAELRNGGGKTQVPCLRIERVDGGVQWLYESKDIIRYLNRRFAP